jgi:hypothetical protein
VPFFKLSRVATRSARLDPQAAALIDAAISKKDGPIRLGLGRSVSAVGSEHDLLLDEDLVGATSITDPDFGDLAPGLLNDRNRPSEALANDP